MSYVRIGLARLARAATWLLLPGAVVVGCDTSHDPATPCPRIVVGDPEPATVTPSARSPILAVTPGQPERPPLVVAWSCDAAGEACELVNHPLPGLAPGSNIIITSTGHHVIGTHASGVLHAFPVTETGVEAAFALEAGPPPIHIVASLRGSEWIIVRDAARRLRKLHPEHPELDLDRTLLAPELPSLKLVALGERHVVGRVVLGHGREELHVIDLADGSVRPLGRGSSFEHVAISAGDTFVVASNTDDPPETLVFAIATGRLVDRFVGRIASGRRAHEEIPGLRAVAPDGGHLAYVTASGSIALRDLESRQACLVRSVTRGTEHRAVGFAANGVMVFESSAEGGSVLAWDPETHRQRRLTARGADMHLAAVPAEVDPERPWVVGVRRGAHYALDGQPEPHPLYLHDPAFVAREGAGIWAIDADPSRSSAHRHLELRYVEPEHPRFRVAAPPVDRREFTVGVNGRVCMSTGTPGSWGERCGNANEATFMLGMPVPTSENP